MTKNMKLSHEEKTSWLDKKIIWFITPSHLIILCITCISLFLHLVNIDAIGDGNLYYTAAVKSMLQSWDNFFFASAEPGGSVTVDKPPLGLWIETLFAYFLGVNGFAVSLPNIISGVLSITLLFHLTKKYFGSLAGIIAAIVYLVTPIVFATNRNNTIDGMLVFTLILAAWAFMKATEKGNLIYLIVGSVLIGLGFNIKMLQAYLVIPAFILLYLIGTKQKWWKKILFTGISLVTILLVSLSWALIVDLTPAEDRPYIGSSENNTVMELIIGHNGLSRLIGRSKGTNPPGDGNMPMQPLGQRPPSVFSPQNPPSQTGGQYSSDSKRAQNPQLHSSGQYPPNQPPRQGGGAPFSHETGEAGIFRLFQAPLAKEMSWLLPFALFCMVMIAFSEPISIEEVSIEHKGVILWGGWMLTCLVFFSMAEFFHAYYMIMLAPPLSVLIGAGFAWLSKMEVNNDWKKGALVSVLLLTIIFQVYLALEYISPSIYLFIPSVIFLLSAATLLFTKRQSVVKVINILLLACVIALPFWWSVQTVLMENPHTGLPSAYAGSQDQKSQPPGDRIDNPRLSKLIGFLQENTQGMEYLLAVPNANSGAPFVLATGRPVLYMGGFKGSDPVIDTTGLEEMVENKDLRYFLYQNFDQENDQQVREWLHSSCQIVEEFSSNLRESVNQIRQLKENTTVLFDCQ